MTDDPVHDALKIAVPLWIDRWHDKPEEQRQERLAQVLSIAGLKQELASRLGFDAVGLLAEILALQACQPGGVTFEGLHWEVKEAG